MSEVNNVESASKSLTGYTREQLHKLYNTDNKTFRDWMNMGPINVYSAMMKDFDHPIFGDYRPLAKIAKNVRLSLHILSDEKTGVSEEIREKISNLIVDLVPALSELSFEIDGDKMKNYSIKVKGWNAENIDANSWLSETIKYDRGRKDYVSEGEELVAVRGHNKLSRIAFLCSPGLMSLFKEMSPEQLDECLKIIRKGKLPSQLVSDEEIERLATYGKWQSEKTGSEPQLPAKARWINLVKEELPKSKIDYEKLKQLIEKEYEDKVVYDDIRFYNMVDVDEEINDSGDIPDYGWDHPATIG